jgi:hypothetical protein
VISLPIFERSVIENWTTGVAGSASLAGMFSSSVISAMSFPQKPLSLGVVISFAA